jgi:alkanesulfonate monooxygenase SsuD/methylene tetrahydromethanopterin reductase-like flavin-dependent oxidoreductase (luciferase family)
MRIGLMLGPERGRYRHKVAQLVADAEAAERDGFTSLWVPQIPGDFDAFTMITLLGRATQRVELGTAVLPIQTRHPVAMAQEFLSNQAVCEGRFTLGLGASHHWVIEGQLGLAYERPAHLMGTYLEVLNAAIRARARWTSRTTASACTARSTSPITAPIPSCSQRSPR